ncbi:hypothetical protein OEZ71_12325 [Defluviimonas sp. WL0050]|uniref:Uncharacterized protein n=2 Tax=Albidovulum litorale TaxID=2984134 RepID=A0ABT2ZPL5_9RHOB|nr:hypothetical protein [Defluviimonas sp. WL0050]
MSMLDHQKTAFAERLKRIEAGKQFEHADLVGQSTQKKFNKILKQRPKHQKRTFADKMMVLLAFLSGISAVLLGRVIYFNMSKLEGLPKAFYDLEQRGMLLFALVLAGVLMVAFHLFTRQRFPALIVGCLMMHYGEAAVASNAQGIWAQLFSADYAAALAEEGKDYRLTPAG